MPERSLGNRALRCPCSSRQPTLISPVTPTSVDRRKLVQVTLDGSHLSLDEVILVAREEATVEVEKEAIARTARGRRALEKSLAERTVVYGVNTGFGALSNLRVPNEEMKLLQSNLIRSHAAGVGPPLSPDVVRAMMLLRANTLLKGFSGIRPEIPLLIVSLLNKHVHPYVPEKGSVGASGDLSPLSHMALVLMGEGKAESKGRWLSGKAALEKAGHRPISLEAKEGLALNNGTQQMLAVGCLALHDAYSLLLTAEAALALSLEAMNGWVDAFDPRIHNARPHPGQRTVATHVRALLEGSHMVRSITIDDPRDGRPQDPYSFRCAPQVLGAVLDALDYTKRVFEIEMNSATDNPLIFPKDSIPLSGGNFHGQPLSMTLDFLGLGVSNLANLSERRTAALLDHSLNNGLPPFLIGRDSKPGLSSGFMALQYTATALVAECKILTHPASSDSIPTSGNFEDFVSMGPGAASKARSIVENAEYVVSIELLCAAQGIDLRKKRILGKGTGDAYRLIRRNVSELTQDRSLHEDVEKVRGMVDKGQIAKIVREHAS